MSHATCGNCCGGPVRRTVAWSRRAAQRRCKRSHLAEPDEALPYNEAWASGVQTWLGHPDLPAKPGYEEWFGLARDLLADEELGFEGMPDVVLFLQTVVAFVGDPKRPALAEGDDAVLYPPVGTRLLLDPDQIDSVLRLPEDTFPSLASALSAHKHAILIGPPGTGKTTLAQDRARHAHDRGFCRGFVSVTATADWTTFDTIGGYMPRPGGELAFRRAG